MLNRFFRPRDDPLRFRFCSVGREDILYKDSHRRLMLDSIGPLPWKGTGVLRIHNADPLLYKSASQANLTDWERAVLFYRLDQFLGPAYSVAFHDSTPLALVPHGSDTLLNNHAAERWGLHHPPTTYLRCYVCNDFLQPTSVHDQQCACGAFAVTKSQPPAHRDGDKWIQHYALVPGRPILQPQPAFLT